MQAHGSNRFISTLAISPNVGGKVYPVSFGSILGSDVSLLTGDWHHHTDNSGADGFGLSAMQSVNAYIGVEFEIDGAIHYGWIHYIGFHHPDSGIPLDVLGGFINSWAYETEPGASIIAGIPEPSTCGLILLSGLAMIGRRTRNQQDAQQDAAEQQMGRLCSRRDRVG